MKLSSVTGTLCENPFGKYCVPLSSQHRLAPKLVLRGGIWERETIEFMRVHSKDRDLVHAGMFFGDFLPGLASAMSEGKVIYGFEPNRENFHCAQWTMALNGLTNVIPHNFGLGAADSAAKMRVRDNGVARGGGSTIIKGAGVKIPESDKEEVQVRSIDGVIPPSADIGVLQLDVEGYEWQALRGGIETIKRCRPIILVETFDEAEFNEVLAGLGYRVTGKVCENTIMTID